MHVEYLDNEPSGKTRREQAFSAKQLYVMDAVVPGGDLLTDSARLAREARAAAESAGANILCEDAMVFPNRAVTLVFILAESHLSIHTWPEEGAMAVDLFSCGHIDGERLIADLAKRFELREVTVRNIPRGVSTQVSGSSRFPPTCGEG
jgi:S-adenosylmethionine decarboxylase